MAERMWGLSYKQLQANFVSNLNGTSLLEISLLASTAPLVVLLRSCLGALFWGNIASCSFMSSSFVFILDYITLVLPLVFASTILSSYIITTLVTLTIIIITCLISSCFITESNTPSHQQTRQPFICNYRAYIIIATAISILAVDFNIFPRRFAKAETYGSGFMDVGVGSFILSNAIVSPEARSIGKTYGGSWLRCTVKSIRSSIPLLVLGLARFLAVKSTDYQEHVSEYGVHWNFFITLFVVKVFSTMLVHLPMLGNPSTFGLVGAIIAIFYQLCLTRWGIEDFLINGNSINGVRHGFINANREGLSSCLGYLALYFMGLQLGRLLFAKRDSWCMLLFVLLVLDGMFWILTAFCRHYITPVSRRMANITYVFWQMGYNLQFIVSFLLVDIITMAALPKNTKPAGCEVCYSSHKSLTREQIRPKNCACFIAAVNRNQLAYFLAANLMTGIVNFSVKTLFCTPSQSLWIVCMYMLVMSSIFTLFHVLGITLKLH